MPKTIDLTGQRFGKWTVLGIAPKDSSGHTMWRCRCDCGTEKDVLGVHLKRGKSTSCGCNRSPSLVGQRFGRLTVLSPAGVIGTSSMRWNCICDCGNKTIVYGHFLKSGHTRSCGCLSAESIAERCTTHGQSDSRLYNIWHGMKSRCYRETDSNYPKYGGRGIQICDQWRFDFGSFYDWSMGHGYADNLSIDRIDNGGNYCPENCRWVDATTQCNNKSNNRLISANGETHTVSEWASILGANNTLLAARLDRGWSDESTINTPFKIYRRHKNESFNHQGNTD